MLEYETDGFFDELLLGPGQPRAGMEAMTDSLNLLDRKEILKRQAGAERMLFHMGITFNVYGNDEASERIFPFDIVPRIVTAEEWTRIEKGLQQRICALNAFLKDVYADQKIVRDGIVPAHVIGSSEGYRPQCSGLRPPKDIWCHITGTDLVRDKNGEIYVLEDNLRCPSGVSYVLENREVMKRSFPEVFAIGGVRPVDDYADRLLDTLCQVAPEGCINPEAAVLTPGVFNSAYFEHSFLAQQMGIELVEGRDLQVIDGYLKMRTTRGYERVDVLYRRIDDLFMDPKAFRPDSLLGVPGLMEVYKAGRVTLANAPGTGVADDKVVYAYVPEIIKYYLGEEPILPNVPTYLCWDDAQRDYVLEHIEDLVVKPANESGGYGMLVGPHSTQEACNEFRERIKRFPRNYIAQPTLSLSRVPTIVGDAFEGRHVDLRPYILYGESIYVLPGGLTRVALKKGSLVVNSSQGGGSKDTWVLAARDEAGGSC